MNNDPLMIVVVFGITLYLAWLWREDLRAHLRGEPHPKALPGATPAPRGAMLLAAAGALVILGLETAGEIVLGISEEQSDITAIYLLAMVAAAFGEELIFRGFLVVEGRGKAAFYASVVGFSLLFTLAHPFLWNYEAGEAGWRFWEGEWSPDTSTKAWFSSAAVFAASLWFYTVRFLPNNPERSLLPCIVAHLAKNLGVFAVKLAQGHVVGLW